VGPTAGLDASEWRKISSLAGSLLRKYAICAVAILPPKLTNDSTSLRNVYLSFSLMAIIMNH
jgi:hypothetical protein